MKEITVIHGFGIKDYDSVIYIDGKLFSEADFHNGESLVKLAKKMAKSFSIKWNEFTAPEVFRLESYYFPLPKTLAIYEKEAVNLFKTLPTLESIRDYIYYSASMEEADIESVVYRVYALSGGLEKDFKDFYNNTYKTTFPQVENELDKEYAYLNSQYNKERYGDKDKQEIIRAKLNEVQTKLINKFEQQLQFVWDYPKALIPFKKLALKKKN